MGRGPIFKIYFECLFKLRLKKKSNISVDADFVKYLFLKHMLKFLFEHVEIFTIYWVDQCIVYSVLKLNIFTLVTVTFE